MSARRRSLRWLPVIAVMAMVAALAPATPAHASQILWFDDEGSEEITIGPNAAVYISLGTVRFSCDFFFPTADIYIVQGRPSDGATLTDVGGGFNTVFGASGGLIGDEMIAVTAPGGKLGEGDYSVVYDECQDKKFDADEDAFFEDVIHVRFPPGEIPPLSPAIGQMKAAAASQALQWTVMMTTLAAYEQLEELKGQIECVLGGLATCALQTVLDAAKDFLIEQAMEAFGLVDPKEAAKDVVNDMITKYAGIAADPPDPDFQHLTTLGAVEHTVPVSAAPFDVAMATLANAAATDAAVSAALLTAMERYQGADAAGNATWALVHARQVQDYARLLTGTTARVTAAVQAVRAVVAATPNRDANAAFAEATRLRIADEGFSDTERAALANRGMSQADQDALRARIAGQSYAGFTGSTLLAQLDTVAAASSGAGAAATALASNMTGIINTLLINPAAANNAPAAEAGGPYNGSAGSAVALSGSSAPGAAAVTGYAWDLDRDGEFDDASTAGPSHAFPNPFTGLIGLRVTDADGRTDVDYAEITIGGGNVAPVVTSATPAQLPRPTTTVGGSIPFTAAATDADPGDTLTYRWVLDGVEDGTGTSYTFDDTGAPGLSSLLLVVDDGHGNLRTVSWDVSVLAPDGDGDGWTTITDCDDGNSAVNPGVVEIQGNSLDDDCDPATSDAVVNDPPVAKNVSVGGFEDQPLTIPLPASDPEGDALAYEIVTAPAADKGAAAVNAGTSTVTFTPALNVTGVVTFTYRVVETATTELLASAPRTVTVTLESVPDVPIAADVAASGPEETTITGSLLGSDGDGTPLTYSVAAPPAGAGWTLDSTSGAFSFTPSPNVTATYAVTYQVSDGVNTDSATLTIEVTPVNDPPVSGNVATSTPEDTPKAIGLPGTDIDGDALTALIVGTPGFGTVSVSGVEATYTPAADFAGTDTFTYRVTDGAVTTAVHTATVTVTPVNDPPVAGAVTVSTGEDIPVVVAMVGTDADRQPLTFTTTSNPTSGALSDQSGRRITYTPTAEYSGADGFTFTVSDGTITTAPAQVSITVNELNDPPVARDDSARVVDDASVVIDVLANDSDIDDTTLSIAGTSAPPGGGSAVALPDNTLRFTPPRGGAGAMNFEYTVTDGSGGSDIGTVTVVMVPTSTARQTFTTQAEFVTGTSVNVVQDGPNRLQLDNQSRAANRIWVAVSLNRPTYGGTVVKIDTDTGQILGEYLTAPNGQARNPSRTTVDLNGNVWLTNRDGNSVVKIGLPENGQCEDRNGNGVIDTSTGQSDVRDWPNTGGLDTDGARGEFGTPTYHSGVETAVDECILRYTRVSSSGTRHVAVTQANDVWVSGTGNRIFNLLDGDTGLILRTEGPVGYGGYGGLIDANGVIWSASYPSPLLRWDTALPLSGPNGGNWTAYTDGGSYGLCIDTRDGSVYNTHLASYTRKYSSAGVHLAVFNHGFGQAQGCVVDQKGHVWVAHSINGGTTVGHINDQGVWVGNVTVGDGSNAGPTGVAVDGKGKIWSTNYNDGTVSRIDPDAGPVGADGETAIGAVDLAPINVLGLPYNYSDMTGSTLTGAPTRGTWAGIADGESAGADWDRTAWTARVPAGGELTVKAATSEDQTTWSPEVAVTSGAALGVPNGRYLRLTVSFTRPQGGESPVLSDLSAWTAPPPPPETLNGEDVTDEDTPLQVVLPGLQVDGQQQFLVAGEPSWQLLGTPLHGTLSNQDGNVVTYTPDPNYFGPDYVNFRVNDGETNTTPKTVFLTVRPVNDPPVADDKTASTGYGTPVDVGLTGSDIEGDPLTFELVTEPGHGSVTITGANARYTPAPGFSGTDTFGYLANDGGGTEETGDSRLLSQPATVTVTVGQPPVIPGGGGETPVTVTPTPTSTVTPTPTPTPTVTPRPQVGSVTLTAEFARITAGNTPLLTGTVRDTGGALMGDEPVTIWWKEYAGSTWRHFTAPVRTNAAGVFAMKVQPMRQTAYIAEAGGVQSPRAMIWVHNRPEITAPAHGAVVPQRTTISGALLPPYPFVEVGIAEVVGVDPRTGQQLLRYLTKGTTDAQGRFSIPVVLPRGQHAFVAYTSAHSGTLTGRKSVLLLVR